MSRSRLPNLIITGVGGAGTTSLFSYLAQHPDICASSVKEVKYFTPLKFGAGLRPVESYAQYFSHCRNEKYAVEASPGYFYGGHRVASAMKRMLPGVHALVILRDPAARVWSGFNYMKMRLRIERDRRFDEYLETALALHSRGNDDLGESSLYWPLASGFYFDYVSEWFETFGPAFRVVFFEELARDPQAVIEEVCEWLGIDTGLAAGFDYSVQNRTVLYKRKRLHRVALTVNDRGERFLRRHPVLKRTLRRVYYRVNEAQQREGFDPSARRRLDAAYAPSNAALRAELSLRGYRQLPAWLGVRESSLAR